MSSFTWESMLNGFRRFGGVAENVEQRQGPHGMGLYAVDRNLPVRVHVPEQLLVPSSNIRAEGETLVLIDTTPYPEGFAEWFAQYHRHFSWGGEGRRSVYEFERGLAALPEAVLESLKAAGLLRLPRRHEGDWESVVLSRFLITRTYLHQGCDVLMPVIELINHGPAANSFREEGGIEVSGIFPSEVLVRYSLSDPIRRFLNYGFSCAEPQAYSLPLQFKLDARSWVRVHSQIMKPKSDDAERLGGHRLPEIKRQGEDWEIDHLLLAAVKTPRIPQTLVHKAFHNEPGVNAGELFDLVHSLNLRAYYAILRAGEPHRSPLVNALREAVMLQLEVLSHHYGLRRDLLD